MPGAVTIGFYGKLPSRGDFLRFGLPRSFTDPWDDWLQACLTASKATLGDDWLPAFLEAPVWRFSLAADVCGPDPAVGLFLPSVDKAGRYFPFTLAAVGQVPAEPDSWLERCEQAGRAALEHDVPPEEIVAMLGDPPLDETAPTGSTWWTAGSPRIPATRLAFPALPPPGHFASMLDADRERVEAPS